MNENTTNNETTAVKNAEISDATLGQVSGCRRGWDILPWRPITVPPRRN